MSESVLYGGGSSVRVRVHHLQQAKERGEKWAMLTAYDVNTAAVFEEAGIPVLLVGDSAGNVVLGHPSTVPVTVEDILMLTRAVVRGTTRTLVVADMPFGSYEAGPDQALATAFRLMKEGGAQAVKLEGGVRVAPQIELITQAGIPDRDSSRICGATRSPPSSFTACAPPSFISRTPVWNACCGPDS